MSDLVGNPEDRFSQNEAQFIGEILEIIPKLSPNTLLIFLLKTKIIAFYNMQGASLGLLLYGEVQAVQKSYLPEVNW